MLKNQKGFSLIELMVVVAIIGILSAVAVPQFQKFQRKAKQSEAKANLSALYTSQKVFLAETGSYYSNIWATGYEPEGDTIYITGFGAGYLGSNLPGYTASPYLHNENTNTYAICGTTYAAGLGVNCQYTRLIVTYVAASIPVSVTASTFLAGATAHNASLGGGSHDAWTMNHRKEIINTINGAL